jgi:hypothetical protein
MNHAPRLMTRAALLALTAAMLFLAACSHGVKSQQVINLEKTMDVKVEAYKSGQFLLDGAVLSPVDLNSHFEYLRDQHRLPKSVLLTRSDDSKIGKTQLLSLARMRITFGFTVYYEKKGKLVRLEVANRKDVPQLRQHENSAPLQDENQGTSAKGDNHFPTGGGG